jgi:hypothetical protein
MAGEWGLRVFGAAIKNHGWGLQIGRLYIIWHDLWPNKYGLWIEWTKDVIGKEN